MGLAPAHAERGESDQRAAALGMQLGGVTLAQRARRGRAVQTERVPQSVPLCRFLQSIGNGLVGWQYCCQCREAASGILNAWSVNSVWSMACVLPRETRRASQHRNLGASPNRRRSENGEAIRSTE